MKLPTQTAAIQKLPAGRTPGLHPRQPHLHVVLGLDILLQGGLGWVGGWMGWAVVAGRRGWGQRPEGLQQGHTGSRSSPNKDAPLTPAAAGAAQASQYHRSKGRVHRAATPRSRMNVP